MSEPITIKRQAVVVIHGIGEQRPMDTLRSFVKNIKGYLEKHDYTEVNTTVRSKPDGVSEIYETRKLSLSASRNRPITDFYEFYWAQNMRGTAISHMTTWLYQLFSVELSKIPPRLKALWSTMLALLIITFLGTGALLYFLGVDTIKTMIASIAAVPFVLFILGIVQKYFKNLFLTTAGDAARYFTPTPSNILERNNIRQQGIAFLKKLHEQVEGEHYDRVIVVAHSLGTAVAYDLLRLAWTLYSETYEPNEKVDQSLIPNLDAFANSGQVSDINKFQELQYLLWKQQRSTGNKWLITDFITLGAAVCSADYFLVSKEPFTDLVKEREFPVCPPVTDDKTNSISFETTTYDLETGNVKNKRSVRTLHHAALFAITRWTNIYFTSDFVGSEGRRLFGEGVKDIPIDRKSWWIVPGGHTKYWDQGSDESLEAITLAMRLRKDSNP